MNKPKFVLYHDDCLEQLKRFPSNHVDAIVTDPPYGLSFMGKKWDYDVPSVEIWTECFRVLKPGGHLLAFAGTRTQHRMACRIEDAGFEIRDMIAWVYGSGFPKSLDVATAIDKLDANVVRRSRRLRFTEWMRSTGLTNGRINELTSSDMGTHYLTQAQQPSVATREHFEILRPFISISVPNWVEALVDERTVESENFKQRDVIGEHTKSAPGQLMKAALGLGAAPNAPGSITTAHTEDAKQWEGWGTALKPALEPITVARKPFTGTVASNVLAHGTGALNIDGCRIDAETATGWGGGGSKLYDGGLSRNGGDARPTTGRWPANLIHDGSDEVLANFPDVGASKKTSGPLLDYSPNNKNSVYGNGNGMGGGAHAGFDEVAGNAARFFYCAKASHEDRNEGCKDLPQKAGGMVSNTSGQHITRRDETYQPRPRGNTHPTVKPTDLMRYLCRLVTPPGGVVLDPFVGSGSTGRGAVLEGFDFIGIERDKESIDISQKRIAAAQMQREHETAQADLFG